MEVKGAVVVNWPMGLHIRPATKIAKLSQKFSCNIQFVKNDCICSAKSVMQLITLAAAVGDSLDIIANGEDAAEAIQALKHLFDDYVEEDEGIGTPF